MREDEPHRSRPIRKSVTFSPGEWEVAERRQQIADVRDFTRFARQAILEGEVRVTRVAFDPSDLRSQLSKIGNNINQIARHVNTESGVTYDEMRAARLLLAQVQQVLNDAAKAELR